MRPIVKNDIQHVSYWLNRTNQTMVTDLNFGVGNELVDFAGRFNLNANQGAFQNAFLASPQPFGPTLNEIGFGNAIIKGIKFIFFFDFITDLICFVLFSITNSKYGYGCSNRYGFSSLYVARLHASTDGSWHEQLYVAFSTSTFEQ